MIRVAEARDGDKKKGARARARLALRAEQAFGNDALPLRVEATQALEPAPLAQLARDLLGALEGTKIGPVTSVILRLETYRLVVRALDSSAGQTTLLVVVGSTARPGLARIELERVVKAIGRS